MTPAHGRIRGPVIVALDVPELAAAVDLAERLAGEVAGFKVGLELFSGHGPGVVAAVAEHGPVFLDLKLHDIPTTVERAARRLARLGVGMLTVHALGGRGMVAAAVSGVRDGASEAGVQPPAVLAVTVLTSLSPGDLEHLGLPPAEAEVPRLAALAVDAGADGIVCAPADLGPVRSAVGGDPVVVTPGVRPAGSRTDDHARAATPSDALRDGATHLVIGRPVTRAEDPAAAARRIHREIEGVKVEGKAE